MAQDSGKYAELGVSSGKAAVHAATSDLEKGLYPGAFCTILPDIWREDPTWCTVLHADGAGTKASLAYLYWKETGDASALGRVMRDSIVMNIDDVMCVGATGPFLVSNSIGRNPFRIDDDALPHLVRGNQEFLDILGQHGVQCINAGGETADVADLVRTFIVDHTVTTQMPRAHVIDANRINAPAFIVGFSSTGQAVWEAEPNSGIGSNGLTLARHETLFFEPHRQYTETYAPELPKRSSYAGRFQLTDELPGDERFTIGSALLSPTRTYMPLVTQLFNELGREAFLGLIHCSGGGQTKIGKFGQEGIVYVKNNLFPIPPLFQMLQEVQNLSWEEFFSVYNGGHRLEAIVRDVRTVEQCVDIAKKCGIDAGVIGTVEKMPRKKRGRSVVIKHSSEEFTYHFD